MRPIFRAPRPAAFAALIACSGLLSGCLVTDVMVPTADVPMTTAAIEPITQDVELVSGPNGRPIAQSQPMPASMPAPMPAPMPQQQAFVPGQPVAMVSPAYGFPAMSRPVLPDENRQENRIVIPKEEIQCRNRLKRLGVQFRDLPPIHDSPSCGIDFPVEVTSLGRGIKLAPKATLNCAMAEEAALWAQRDLAPAARRRYLSGIAEKGESDNS